MKHKVSELEGAPLDAAVAKCEGLRPGCETETVMPAGSYTDGESVPWVRCAFAPSSNWMQGGPIIERERIELLFGQEPSSHAASSNWLAMAPRFTEGSGSTPLIAAMRAYVASKFGEDVELP